METIPPSVFRVPRAGLLSSAPEGLVLPDEALLSKEEVTDS